MPPPQTVGADWPPIQYGQSSSNELPWDELVATIEQMVGRPIPSTDATAVHEKWFFRNVWWPERNSRQLAFRLYRGSGGVDSFDEWFRSRGQPVSNSVVVDLRRFDRNRYLYDLKFDKLYRQSGWGHNAFLPAVWLEKTSVNCRWLEYFLSTQPAGSVQLFTITTPRVPTSQYSATFAWFKEVVLPLLQKVASAFGGELIGWRMDWGRLKPGVLANLHVHMMMCFSNPASDVLGRCWRLRDQIKSQLGERASVYYSARQTGDARRLAGYFFLVHSAHDYAKLTDAELLEFFRAVKGVRKYQFCGSLYKFISQKKAAGIASVSRVLTENGQWEFCARRAEPVRDDPQDDGNPQDGEYFGYHMRPFVCALAQERYSLCLAIMPQHGGRVDLEKIRNHPWIAALVKKADEAFDRNSSAIKCFTSIHPHLLLPFFRFLTSRRIRASRKLPYWSGRLGGTPLISLDGLSYDGIRKDRRWWCWQWPWPWRCWRRLRGLCGESPAAPTSLYAPAGGVGGIHGPA